jgi:energy-coupling factor transport system substrate-specific component
MVQNKTKRIALLGLLTSFIYVGRVSFSFLPNVQPMTTILIIITLSLGLADGLIVALLSLVVSNLSLGFGVWTIAQLIAFTVVLLVVYPFRRIYNNIPLVVMAFISGFTGLLYGFIISLVQAPFFGWLSFFPYYISGIPYDIAHAVGNFVFYLLLAPLFYPIIDKQTNKLYLL